MKVNMKQLKKDVKQVVKCEVCSKDLEVGNSNIKSGVCWRCLVKLEFNTDPLNKTMLEVKSVDHTVNYPGSWQKMEMFVDQEGNVYKFGKLMKKEFGKHKPTSSDELYTWYLTNTDIGSKHEKKQAKDKKNLDKKIEHYKKSKAAKAKKKKGIKK